MKGRKFKISVVIPVYNVELYLRDTIESVVKQDMGFLENIQIILVNDGSTDASEEICKEYQKRYPDNVLYLYQDNAGVSVARNTGMDYVEGEYVNFLDSDDMWSADAFSAVYAFFERHKDEVNLVSCKQEFFEGKTGLHRLSEGDKFETSRVINILEEYQYTQFHITASFVKADSMRMTKFDPEMKYGEDAVYVSELILDKHKYGVVAEPTHFYRKRKNNSSAIQGKEKALDWYQVTPQRFYQKLMDISKSKWGCVIPYVQYATCYDLQWRLRDRVDLVLSEKEKEEYLAVISKLLQQCDDDIIFKQHHISSNKKIFLTQLKYKRDIAEEVVYSDGKLLFQNMQVSNLQKNVLFHVDILEIRNRMLRLSGKIDFKFADRMSFFFQDNTGEKYPVEMHFLKKEKIWNIDVADSWYYGIEIPLEKLSELRLVGEYDHKYRFHPCIVLGKFAKLYNLDFENDYYSDGEYLITLEDKVIKVKKCTDVILKEAEEKYIEDIMKSETISPEDKKEALLYRKKYFRMKKRLRKKIWLVSDRIHVAGDNGEAFFRYLRKRKPKDIEVYFVLARDSKDYARMRRIGKVIPYGSKKCKLYTLLADKIISSQGEDNIVNPFYGQKYLVGNLMQYDYIFLQHGIIKDDLSTWLNRSNKNISMFVTSAYPEYKSILEEAYMYGEEEVQLTGLPRYDSLIQDIESEKKIVFMPTWRTGLALEMDQETGRRAYNPRFVESVYYQFYNRLINDERILKALQEKGYKGKFCVHTNNISNAEDFHGNEYIEISQDIADYQKEFKQNRLLVTDYSSVAYDFAYLKKPVIYTQPDREEFFKEQVYDEGYWDYEKMGFGPVCYDYEGTVSTILDMLEKDCKMEKMYLDRIEKFYYKFDQRNCERVYDAIRKIR